MIKIPYSELGKMNTQQVMQKLANSTFKTPRAFAIKHVTKAVRDGFFAMREQYEANIVKAYHESDAIPEAGTKSAELKLPFTCKPGLEADAKGALEAFGKQELKIDRKKLDAVLLFECNSWSPVELEVLEFLFEEPSELA